MDIQQIVDLIAQQGLSLVLVAISIVGLYKGIKTGWDYFKEREIKQEEREHKVLEQLDKSNTILKETTDTNKMLVDKITVKMDKVESNVEKMNMKLDIVLNKKSRNKNSV